ncbi:MAG: type II toxin-antitoxin system PemK/MazF family toxin [Clostridia bacterium]|nr:type II toxin-antitoxin system PemK/MazF family toxin [Clostridia bacterium]
MYEVRKGEIYYADLSPVVGSEQGGIRPVVILQNDKGNHYSSTTIIAAVTSRKKKNYLPTHIEIKNPNLKRKSVIMLEQVRTIDKSRLLGYIGKVDEGTMRKIDKAVKISFEVK